MIGAARLRFVQANLIWRCDGSLWAGWTMTPDAVLQGAETVIGRLIPSVRALVGALRTPTQILGLADRVTLGDLVNTSTNGFPTEDPPNHLHRLTTMDGRWVMDQQPITRRYYIFTQLSGASVFHWFTPSPARDALSHQLHALHQRLRHTLPIEPVSTADILTLERRAAGLPAHGQTWAIRVFEGGEGADRRLGDRRFVKICYNQRSHWQGTAMLSHMPATFTTPGPAAWFQAADGIRHPMDWAVYLEPIDNRIARRRCAQQRRQLVGQEGEYAGDPAGAPPSLQAAIAALDQEQQLLQAFPSEPALTMHMGWSARHHSRTHLVAAFEELQAVLEPHGFGIHRPTGGQIDGLLSLCPGMTPPVTFTHYPQHVLPADVATGLPLTPIGVGDPSGIPIGVASLGPRGACTPVFLDPALGPTLNRSGSMAVFGTLGSGKSYFVKRMILGALARGHRVSVFDRTIHGEYAQLADLHPGRTRVVSLNEDAGLDPLICVPGQVGEDIAVTVLSMIARVGPTEPDGIRLAQAVHEVARSGGAIAHVPAVLAQDAEAAHIAAHLEVMFRQPLAKVLINSPAKALGDVDYLCFHAPGLHLPDRDTTVHAHLAQDILPTQLIGKAIIHLVTAISHHAIMSCRDRFGVHVVDEAWALTSSPASLSMLLDAVRDGRKHNAALWLLSQDPADIGDPALAHLMGTRVVFRCDQGALPKAAQLLGMNEPVVHTIPELETGTCVMRDLYGRVGVVRIGMAGDPTVHEAFNTTPSTLDAGGVR